MYTTTREMNNFSREREQYSFKNCLLKQNIFWFNHLKFYANFKLIKLANFFSQKGVLGSVMPQLKWLFMLKPIYTKK